MRCFVGFDVSDATRQLAVGVRELVTRIDPEWRAEKWVALENLHVTLAFLGDVPEADVSRLVTLLRGNSLEPFTVGTPAVEPVPGIGRASLIWIRYVEGSAECTSLAAYVLGCASEVGLMPVASAGRFVPHVTLVRARSGRELSQGALTAARRVLDVTPNQVVSVSSVRVFASSLGRVGPTYRELAKIPLAGARTV